MAEFFDEERLGDRVLRMTLNRPPANALTVEFLGALDGRLRDLAHEGNVRALLITGAGRALSAGLDLKQAPGFTRAQQTAMVDGLNRVFANLYAFPKPVITAVNGPAIAGGLFFVLAADYRIAAPGALFGLTEVRIGARFPVSPLEIARAELAPAAARRILLGGRNVEAQNALATGLIDEIAAPDGLLARSEAVAHDYAAIPPKAFAGVKAQLRAPALATMNAAIANKTDPTRDGWYTDETPDAMRALFETARSTRR